jgi:hypothetical protein
MFQVHHQPESIRYRKSLKNETFKYGKTSIRRCSVSCTFFSWDKFYVMHRRIYIFLSWCFKFQGLSYNLMREIVHWRSCFKWEWKKKYKNPYASWDSQQCDERCHLSKFSLMITLCAVLRYVKFLMKWNFGNSANDNFIESDLLRMANVP